MRKKKLLPALAAFLLILSCACGPANPLGGPDPTVSPAADSGQDHDTQNDTSQTDLPGSTEEPDSDVPPREGMMRSRLTNEWVDADTAMTRPIAVIIPNEANAAPQYNLSEASVIYEANVEKRISRLMAVYEDWEDLNIIGNIRSLRTYFAYWAFEWDAFLVHSGGPYFVDELLADPNTQNVNDHLGTDTEAFYRDSSRPMPHNLYATGQGILKVVTNKGYPLSYRGLADQSHYRFSGPSSPNVLSQYGDDAKSAVYIDMSGCYPLTRCYFEYEENDGLYYRYQYLSGGEDGPHVDGETGRQLSFKNILVQYVDYQELGEEGYLEFACQDEGREGWFFTNGKGIHITWEQDSDYGNEIALNTGKTMVCIVLEGDNFTFR